MQSTSRSADVGPHDPGEGRETFVTRFRPIVVWLLAIMAVILTGWALRALAVVVVPFVIALFITLAVLPIDGWVRDRMPRRLKWMGHAVATVVVVALLSSFFVGVYFAAQQAVRQMPNVTGELRALLPGGEEPGSIFAGGAGSTGGSAGTEGSATGDSGSDIPVLGGGTSGDAGDALTTDRSAAADNGATAGGGLLGGLDLKSLADRVVVYLSDHAGGTARAILNAGAGLIGGLVLIIFLVLLMLVEGATWRAKVATIFSEPHRADWEDTFAVMAKSFRWYVIVRVLLGLVSGTLYVGWLAIFGVDLLLVWFLLAFFLNFIPTIGSIIAGTLPVIYVFVTRDWTTGLMVGAGLLVIEQVMGNYVDPRVQGKQLSVSPVVTFLALLLFGWMWGVIGALLAVPIAVFLVIAFAHVPTLKPVALLLSDAENMDALDEKTRG